MGTRLCLGCLELFAHDPEEENGGRECECAASAGDVLLTPMQALELGDRKWISASLERIADALEELCTFKENEVRERNAATGFKEH